jgi:mannose-6-phosphate isomerase-like protein (cupin superfamily)
MDPSRRELCMMLPALLALPAQTPAQGALPSRVYAFDSLPKQPDGPNEYRPVFDGLTHNGYKIQLHETDLAPGSSPHPPHHHTYEEIFLVREGSLVVTINGRESKLGPGAVAYISSNQEHGIQNVGSGHARYFVFELGAQDS